MWMQYDYLEFVLQSPASAWRRRWEIMVIVLYWEVNMGLRGDKTHLILLSLLRG